MTTKAPSILIVEDEALVAKEIEMILRRLGYRIAGNTRNGDEALDLLVTRKPDLALLDIHIKGTRNGIDLAKHIREKHHIPFVFLTAFSDRSTLNEVGKTLPYGYVVKPFNERDLLSSIELALHKHESEQVGGFPAQEKLNRQLANPLTQREYEVLQQLDQGLTYQQVSDELNVSINTVKTYQKAIFSKMGVSSRLECLRMARKLIVALFVLIASLGCVYGQTMEDPEFEALINRYRAISKGADTSLIVSKIDSVAIYAEANEDDVARGVHAFYKGKYLRRMGKYDQASAELNRALTYLEGTGYDLFLSSTYTSLARVTAASGDYAKVFEYGSLGYQAALKGEDSFQIGQALNTMAIAKRRMGDPKGAIKYLRLAADLFSRPSDYFSPIVNIASCYNNIGNLDSANYYFNEAIMLARKGGKDMENQLAVALTNYGDLCAKTNEAERGMQMAQEALGIFKRVGSKRQQIAAESVIALAQRVLDNPSESLIYLHEARRKAEESKDVEGLLSIYGGLLDAHSQLNTSDSIRYYSISMLAAKDSLNLVRRDEFMAEMEARFEVRENQRTVEIMNNRFRTQRLLTFIAVGGILVLCGLLWFAYRQRKRIAAQNEVIATSLAEKETLLKEIHHRVKNNLQMVSTLLSLQSNYVDDPSALSALQMGRSRVRSMAIIHQGLYMQDSVTPTIAADDYLRRLTGELMASYTDPQKAVQLHTNFQKIELDIDQLIPLGLIANELITNAMKYAFEGRDEGQLNVNLTQEAKGQIMLRVTDDGPGSDAFYKEKTDSFGSLLVQTLTEQLDGRLEVMTQHGTDVRVIFEA